MGYEKEIIVFKKTEFSKFSAIDLLDSLKQTSWEPTLSVINRGNDFDWIQLASNNEGHAEFIKIIEDKIKLNEYIGFILKNSSNDRFVTVNMYKERISFSLLIMRTENELEWFEWYYDNLIKKANSLIDKASRIEWRTNFDNGIIKLIEFNKNMKQINLGSQGLRVPAIGLGCMGMSDFYGSSSEVENLRVLNHAAEIGCTFWDTADMYGPFTNELLLSKALKGRRDQITLATKFGVSRKEDGSWQGIKGNADYVKACCEASLKRLGTDYIDLYFQHRLDPQTPIEETVGAMAELVKAGKVRYIGLSEADPETIARAHQVHPISALQTEYSLWSRDVEADILPTIQQLNIGFVAYSPLGRGFLSGAIRSRSDLDPSDWRLENPRFSEEAISQNIRLADVVTEIAKELGATAAQVALAWLLSRKIPLATIPGTRSIERLEENWAAQNITLQAEHLDRLEFLIQEGVAGNRY